MTDRLDEVKRLHAEPPCALTWWADEMQRAADSLRKLDDPDAKFMADGNAKFATALRNAAALAEAAERVVTQSREIAWTDARNIERSAMEVATETLIALRAAVDRVRGRA